MFFIYEDGQADRLLVNGFQKKNMSVFQKRLYLSCCANNEMLPCMICRLQEVTDSSEFTQVPLEDVSSPLQAASYAHHHVRPLPCRTASMARLFSSCPVPGQGRGGFSLQSVQSP